jgi:hypothetical protein
MEFKQEEWDIITKINDCDCTPQGEWKCTDHFNYLGVESKITPELTVKVIKH